MQIGSQLSHSDNVFFSQFLPMLDQTCQPFGAIVGNVLGMEIDNNRISCYCISVCGSCRRYRSDFVVEIQSTVASDYDIVLWISAVTCVSLGTGLS